VGFDWKYELDEDALEVKFDSQKVCELYLAYDKFGEPLEKIYFQILHVAEKNGLKISKKLSDEFFATVGSSMFGDMGLKLKGVLSFVQELGRLINEMTKASIAILNELAMLKEELDLLKLACKDPDCNEINFWISKDIEEMVKKYEERYKEIIAIRPINPAVLYFKDKWLREADTTRTLELAKTVGARALVDYFYLVRDAEEAYKLPTNERIRRMVAIRIQIWREWMKRIAKTLRVRYNLLKTYFKTHINYLYLYLRVALPYLKYVSLLLQKDIGDEYVTNPELVKLFETSGIEITLVIEGEKKGGDENNKKDGEDKEKKSTAYYPLVFIHINFVGLPKTLSAQGQQAHSYTFTGKVRILIEGVVLDEENYKKVIEKKRNDLYEAMKKISNVSLSEMKELIMEVFEDEIKEKNKIEGLEWLITEEDIKKFKEKKEKEGKKSSNNNQTKKEKKEDGSNSGKEEKKRKINPQQIPVLDAVYGLYYLTKPLKDFFVPINLSFLRKKEEKKEEKKDDDEKKKNWEEAKKEAIDKAVKFFEKYKSEIGLPTLS